MSDRKIIGWLAASFLSVGLATEVQAQTPAKTMPAAQAPAKVMPTPVAPPKMMPTPAPAPQAPAKVMPTPVAPPKMAPAPQAPAKVMPTPVAPPKMAPAPQAPAKVMPTPLLAPRPPITRPSDARSKTGCRPPRLILGIAGLFDESPVADAAGVFFVDGNPDLDLRWRIPDRPQALTS